MGTKKFSHTHRSTMWGLKKLASGVFPESWKVLAERRRRQKRTKNNKSPGYPGWLNKYPSSTPVSHQLFFFPSCCCLLAKDCHKSIVHTTLDDTLSIIKPFFIMLQWTCTEYFICQPFCHFSNPSMMNWDWFNVHMAYYQYRNSHCGDKMIWWPSCVHNEHTYMEKWHLHIESGPCTNQIF